MKKKSIAIFVIIIIINSICISYSYATAVDDLGDLNEYIPDKITGAEEITTKANAILGIIQTIGVVISVVVLIILGIKYMLGSIEERASYKESFKPYIIGAFLLFTGSLLPNLIYTWVTNIKNV